MFRVLVYSHRCIERSNFIFFLLSKRWRHTKVINSSNVEVLVRLLGIAESHAYNILKDYGTAGRLTKNQIIRSHALCLEHGINNVTIKAYPGLLKLKPTILEQRIRIYKDFGCPQIKPNVMILAFSTGLSSTPNELKARGLLPPDADVTKNLLSCLHKPPRGVPAVKFPSDDERLDVIHEWLLRHYLSWKLELNEEQLNRIMNSSYRFKNQSFSLLREMLDILLNEFGFSKEKIIRNSFLLSKSPNNTRMILEQIPKIGSSNTKDIVIRYPRVLQLQVDVLREKIDIIKACNVPEGAVSVTPCILSLSTDTIAKRIQEFKTMKELAGHWKNPRILLLIFYLKGVKRNTKRLAELDIQFNDVHILCASKRKFEMYTQLGCDRSKGKDVLRFLANELELDKVKIQLSLKRHPLWCQIPFLFVQETYAYLRQKNFSSQAIFNNIHIVLYRRSQVQRYLQKIDSEIRYKSRELTDSRKLALCLYDIEKRYHFNGCAVWNCTRSEEKQV